MTEEAEFLFHLFPYCISGSMAFVPEVVGQLPLTGN